jgi:hypothetical protein
VTKDGLVVQHVSPGDAAEVQATMAWLDRYCREAPGFARRCTDEPQPGSTATSEMGEEGLRTAYSTGALYLGSAIDYLLAIGHLLGSGFVPNFAGYALARGCLEAGARAAWLFDPSLTTRHRSTRSLLERIDSLENQYKVTRDDDHLKRRLGEVHAAAERQRISVTKKKRTFCVDGESRPTTTELVEELLRGMTGLSERQHWFFALLCGFTHSAGFATILNARRGGQDAAGWTWIQTDVEIPWVTGAVLMSARVHALALARLGQLTGWSGAPAP